MDSQKTFACPSGRETIFSFSSQLLVVYSVPGTDIDNLYDGEDECVYWLLSRTTQSFVILYPVKTKE